VFRGRPQLGAARFAADRFAAQLRSAGVSPTGTARSGSQPADARTIAVVPSRSVAELTRFINVPSNNFAAEMLFRELGAQYRELGTLANGAAVVRATLSPLGVHPRIVDGSGLSRENRASPLEVVRLLDELSRRDIATTFRDSLAVTGDTGTVKARMRGTPADGRCHVKTGTLRLVSGLAGYCHTAGGRDVAFSLMFNRANIPAAKAREDRIAAAIARLSTASATPAATQTPPGTTTAPAAAPVVRPQTGGAPPRT